MLVLLALSGCVEEQSPAPPPEDSNVGWVTIYQSESDVSPTTCDSVDLSGEAFVSPSWWRCCTGSGDDSGVTVTWSNPAAGQSGTAEHDVDYGTYFFRPYPERHRWWATVPLAANDNEITITASDPAGNYGAASIHVFRDTESLVPCL